MSEEITDAFDIKNIQAIIKKVRKMRGYTQKDLGALVGVSAAQICKIEKSYTNTTFSTILEIFTALGIVATFKPINLTPNDQPKHS